MATLPPEGLRGDIMVGLLGNLGEQQITRQLVSLTLIMTLTLLLSSKGSTERVFNALT